MGKFHLDFFSSSFMAEQSFLINIFPQAFSSIEFEYIKFSIILEILNFSKEKIRISIINKISNIHMPCFQVENNI